MLKLEWVMTAADCLCAVQLPNDAEIIMATLKMKRREQTAVQCPPSTYAQDVATITSHTGLSHATAASARAWACIQSMLWLGHQFSLGVVCVSLPQVRRTGDRSRA